MAWPPTYIVIYINNICSFIKKNVLKVCKIPFQGWEFIKENKKVRKKEKKNDPENKKTTKKKSKDFIFFLITFLVEFLFSFFLNRFLGRVLFFCFTCFLTFLFSFINAHLWVAREDWAGDWGMNMDILYVHAGILAPYTNRPCSHHKNKDAKNEPWMTGKVQFKMSFASKPQYYFVSNLKCWLSVKTLIGP